MNQHHRKSGLSRVKNVLAWLTAGVLVPGMALLKGQASQQARVHSTHSVSSSQNLDFGTLIAGTGGGTLVIDSSNTRSATGTVVPMLTAPAPVAGFITIRLNSRYINGWPGNNRKWVADYYLFIGDDQCATATAEANDPEFNGFPIRPPNPYDLPNITLNRVGGGASMSVNFTPQNVAMSPGYSLTNIYGIDLATVISPPQYIVGTLSVAANQMTGTYNGSVTFPYNDGYGYNTTTVNVRATVMAPLTLAKTLDMNFGTLVVGGAGTAILSPAGVLTTSPAITTLPSVPSAAQFSANGAQGNSYLFSLPASVTLSNGSGGTVVVDTFTVSRPLTGTFPAPGSQPVVFNVGGTLHMTGTEPDGLYLASLVSGGSTFTANIVYN